MTVVDVVPAELESGRAQGRSACDVLRQLVVSGVVEIVSIEDAASQCFEELVVGPAAETLDDGEAATVAVALGLRVKDSGWRLGEAQAEIGVWS